MAGKLRRESVDLLQQGNSHQDDAILDKVHALETIKDYIPSWRKLTPTDITMTRLSGGLCNTIIAIKRLDDEDHDPVSNPKNLILHKVGGVEFGRHQEDERSRKWNELTQEVVVSYELSRIGWGPRLYAIFDGGRIEELLEGSVAPFFYKTLRDDPTIALDIAKTYARLHSLNLPLPDRTDSIFTSSFRPFTEEIMKKLKEGNYDLSLFEMNAEEYLPWIRSRLEADLHSRIVVCHFDTNQLNVFIRSDPKPGEQRVVLLDYEMMKKSFRALDIGSHFVNRSIKWDSDTNEKSSGCPFPSIEERKLFIAAYLEETQQLDHLKDFDKDGRDSVDHVLEESQLGSLWFTFLLSDFLSSMAAIVLASDSDLIRAAAPLAKLRLQMLDELNANVNLK